MVVQEGCRFKGFIHTETSVFHSLWLFREVVLKGSFNFELNILEFLRLRLWPFIEVVTL